MCEKGARRPSKEQRQWPVARGVWMGTWHFPRERPVYQLRLDRKRTRNRRAHTKHGLRTSLNEKQFEYRNFDLSRNSPCVFSFSAIITPRKKRRFTPPPTP